MKNHSSNNVDKKSNSSIFSVRKKPLVLALSSLIGAFASQHASAAFVSGDLTDSSKTAVYEGAVISIDELDGHVHDDN